MYAFFLDSAFRQFENIFFGEICAFSCIFNSDNFKLYFGRFSPQNRDKILFSIMNLDNIEIYFFEMSPSKIFSCCKIEILLFWIFSPKIEICLTFKTRICDYISSRFRKQILLKYIFLEDFLGIQNKKMHDYIFSRF